jgi:hypothetical protein
VLIDMKQIRLQVGPYSVCLMQTFSLKGSDSPNFPFFILCLKGHYHEKSGHG